MASLFVCMKPAFWASRRRQARQNADLKVLDGLSLYENRPPTPASTKPTPCATTNDISTVSSSNTVFESEEASTHRALVIASKRQYALLELHPSPKFENDTEVMVRNHAVGLNPIDWKSVDYNFCLPAFPWVTGREMAGVVEKVGSRVTEFKKGDRVWTSTYYRDVRAGCFQELVMVPQHTVSPIPNNMTFEAAACLGVAGLTAAMTLWKWLNVLMPSACLGMPQQSLFDRDQEYLLVWGGSTVTGQFAIQIAVRCGLKVIAVTSEKTKGLAEALGAEVVTRDSKAVNEIVGEILAIAGDRITKAIDLVGDKNTVNSLMAVSKSRQVDFAPLAMMGKHSVMENVTVHTVEMKRFVLDEKSSVYSKELNRMIQDGLIRLPEIQILVGGLSVIEEGLELLKRGDMNGRKLVVSMAEK
ncbi:Dehydrogenase [Lachnellula subtilissima]|uniref:Dehydrogenase n=1 Tax=Lachnellula subtilissima TaxID=602034 RepID=A0A8H8S0J8_9HELO|nr:Dehydrogenase [Lachnellula subtilissima]